MAAVMWVFKGKKKKRFIQQQRENWTLPLPDAVKLHVISSLPVSCGTALLFAGHDTKRSLPASKTTHNICPTACAMLFERQQSGLLIVVTLIRSDKYLGTGGLRISL